MSAPSGGFYKYHCRYYLQPHCTSWVYIYNETCATCLAEGREEEPLPAVARTASRDVLAPHIRNGILQYAHMEVAVSEQGEESLVVRSQTLNPPPQAIPVTTMMPRGVALVASAF